MNYSTNNYQLDQNAYNRLHDAILDVFDEDVTNEQIDRLIAVCPAWNGVTDTLGVDELMDCLTSHFVNRKVPAFGSSDIDKAAFETNIGLAKPVFMAFIQNKPSA